MGVGLYGCRIVLFCGQGLFAFLGGAFKIPFASYSKYLHRFCILLTSTSTVVICCLLLLHRLNHCVIV